MKQRGSARVLFGALLLSGGVAAAAAEPGKPLGDTMEMVDSLLDPFWQSETMRGESLFFVDRTPGALPFATLAFPPTKIVAVKSASGETTYAEGPDYRVDSATGIIRLPAGSRIPVKTLAEMYPPATSVLPKISHRRDDPATCLIWSEGHFFHDLQVEVTYTHTLGLWQGPVPAFAGAALPRTLRKLRHREPLKLCLVGDSISQGYNASSLTKVAPNMPCYGQLVALGLERAYAARIEFQNFAVAGWRIENGLGAIEKPIAWKPDLVIVAFGMNDSGKSPAQYADGIRQIQAKIREGVPEVEFVLVGSMTPNPEWSATWADRFPLFRDELAKLCGPGAALADLTGVWTELLRRKGYHDLTGNGVNHPNDFGHRLYAQVILGLLVDRRRQE